VEDESLSTDAIVRPDGTSTLSQPAGSESAGASSTTERPPLSKQHSSAKRAQADVEGRDVKGRACAARRPGHQYGPSRWSKLICVMPKTAATMT